MLKGKKVLLRPAKPEDVVRQYEFDQDAELYGLNCTFPQVTSMAMEQAFYESRSKIDENIAPFAMEADGKYIGFCSLMNIRDRHGNVELGIVIGDRDYWGKGYGRDAITVLLHYGFHYLGVRRIALFCHANNERAINCYKACGFVEEGRERQVIWIEGAYIDGVKMSILRAEWQAMQDG